MALTIDLEAGLRPPPPPERGTPDGRFVFKELLGQGAEGLVYLAIPTRRTQQQPQQHQQHQGLDSRLRGQQPSAVKVVSGGRAYERCRASRGLWPKLVHPNVVFPRESWWDEANSRCFVQMELCETDMLDLVCETGPLGDARGSTFAGHLASALAHLHGQGIAHQDVKLENIFVSREGVAKLGDVGSVVRIVPSPIQEEGQEDGSRTKNADDLFIDASITSSSFVGSVMYAPPEAIRRNNRRSSSSCSGWRTEEGAAASSHLQQHQQQKQEESGWRRDPFAGDMWALGVSIWSAMAGCHPWELACVDRSKEFRTFVRQGAAATLPAGFSPGLRSLLSRLLSMDPRKRPTAAEVLASRWVSAPPTTPPTCSSRSGRPGASNAIPSWPCTLAPSDDEEVSSPQPQQQQQQQQQQRQPAPVTPNPTDADEDPAAFPHPSGGGDGAATTAAETTTITTTTPVGGTSGLGRPLEQERQLLLNVSEAAAAASAASPTATVVADAAIRTEGPVAAAATPAAAIVSSATTINAIEPSPVRSRHRRSKKRKAPEEEEEEEEEQRGLAAGAATAPRESKKKTGFVLEDHAEQKEALSFSPEMNALGNVLLTNGDGGGGDGDGGGEERPAKIARVSPSPLTLPTVMMATTAAEKIEQRGRGCNNSNNNVAMRPSSPSALFSGLGTRQSLMGFLSQWPAPPATTRTTRGSALLTTLPVPTSARAAAASGNIWDAGEGTASAGGAFTTISFAPGERRV